MIPASSVVNREHVAIVVVDVQERLAAAMVRREQVVARSALLARVAAIVGCPIIVTRQYPRGLGGVEPELMEVLEQLASEGGDVHTVDKLSFDCFGESAFCETVAQVRRGQLVLCGMETHICVSQTALAALREGFDVHIAGDACCSREMECHELALGRLSHAGAAITTAESVAYELVGCAGTDEFKALLAAVKG